ncbi:hypothetical protein MD537_09705 [Flavihumibacter sediminis]|nr:hypothetical protein [Flavihumibacter sediminis]
MNEQFTMKSAERRAEKTKTILGSLLTAINEFRSNSEFLCDAINTQYLDSKNEYTIGKINMDTYFITLRALSNFLSEHEVLSCYFPELLLSDIKKEIELHKL